ncbi:MAG: hypothetical protein HY719_16160 [Planctomycetes bacterium]|nr:hypothetical protein [Planctomycetota bacterium]
MAPDIAQDPFATAGYAATQETAEPTPGDAGGTNLRGYVVFMSVLAALLLCTTVLFWRLASAERDRAKEGADSFDLMRHHEARINAIINARRAVGGREFEEKKGNLQNLMIPIATRHGITIRGANSIKPHTGGKGRYAYIDNGVTYSIPEASRSSLAKFLYDIENTYPFLRTRTLNMTRQDKSGQEAWRVDVQIVYRTKAPPRRPTGAAPAAGAAK